MTDNNSVLSKELVEKVSTINVFDNKGNEVVFGDLFASTKTIVIFVRHFFCGMCQAYVSQLAQVPRNALEGVNVKLVVIGCGDWNLIDNYKKATEFQGELYADPQREIYHALGLVESLKMAPSGEPRKSYVPGVVTSVLKSIWQGPITNPTHVGKQGNISQLGGDFIFGPGKVCTFAHPMKHTQDHIEVKDLMKEAGVTF
ncbi:hypothetical protein PNOK_0288300 [Pyrrhoderma noxium]|uniref:Uncharacterized protein n=1 Tax=Pyrrhoderma noxium TaxID=2282107 RepID=A0A286UTI5_9AGAM|nr:hypothetical protein PNOK_0288300 [Pyrrhoderma noxium]